MSKVEIAKIGIRAVASVAEIVARTPTKSWFRGPASTRARHGPLCVTPSGTSASAQTRESSASDRLTLHKSPAVAQPGIGWPGSSRQMASLVGAAVSCRRPGAPPHGLATWGVSLGLPRRNRDRPPGAVEGSPTQLRFDTLRRFLSIWGAYGAVAQRERASLAWKRSRVRFPPAPLASIARFRPGRLGLRA